MREVGLTIFGCILFGFFLTAILFVVFGQVTVRKLRKNPATRAVMGFEGISGGDIANVAFSLLVPKSHWYGYRQRRTQGWPSLDPGLLHQHMSKLDRILGKILASVWLTTILALLAYICADGAGVFN
jgi:hypothetical protein